MADFDTLLEGNYPRASMAKELDVNSASELVERSLPLALKNVLQYHSTEPEKTFERMNALHKFLVLTLETHPELALPVGRILEAAFRVEKNEVLLEFMGDSIGPLVERFPDLASTLAETIAQRWLTLKERTPSIHVAQTFNAVCRQANRPELFIKTCLRRTWEGAEFSLGPGSPYFDNHLQSCKENYEDLVNEILHLCKSKRSGTSDEYTKQYETLIARLT